MTVAGPARPGAAGRRRRRGARLPRPADQLQLGDLVQDRLAAPRGLPRSAARPQLRRVESLRAGAPPGRPTGCRSRGWPASAGGPAPALGRRGRRTGDQPEWAIGGRLVLGARRRPAPARRPVGEEAADHGRGLVPASDLVEPRRRPRPHGVLADHAGQHDLAPAPRRQLREQAPGLEGEAERGVDGQRRASCSTGAATVVAVATVPPVRSVLMAGHGPRSHAVEAELLLGVGQLNWRASRRKQTGTRTRPPCLGDATAASVPSSSVLGARPGFSSSSSSSSSSAAAMRSLRMVSRSASTSSGSASSSSSSSLVVVVAAWPWPGRRRPRPRPRRPPRRRRRASISSTSRSSSLEVDVVVEVLVEVLASRSSASSPRRRRPRRR